jgi:hypothetical protein
MGDDQRHGVGALSLLVDEMDAQAIDIGFKVGEGIDQIPLATPIGLGEPVFHQFFDVAQIAAVVIVSTRQLFWPASAL